MLCKPLDIANVTVAEICDRHAGKYRIEWTVERLDRRFMRNRMVPRIRSVVPAMVNQQSNGNRAIEPLASLPTRFRIFSVDRKFESLLGGNVAPDASKALSGIS